MGMSPEADLVYGYHLGSTDGWELEGVDEWGTPSADLFPWLTPEQVETCDEFGDGQFLDLVERRLLAEVTGFTETDWRVDGYRERLEAARAELGLKIHYHGGEYGSFSLVLSDKTYRYNVEWGEVAPVDLATLSYVAAAPAIANKFSRALEVTNLRPRQDEPQWLLTAKYS